MTDDELRRRAKPIIEHAMSKEGLADDVRATEHLATDLQFAANQVQRLEEGLATNDPATFDIALAVCASMVRQHEPLPDFLAQFAADFLDGSRARPKVRGHDPLKAYEQDFLITRAINALVSKLGVPRYTNSETAAKLTASQLVAEHLRKTDAQIKGAYRREKARAKKDRGGKVKGKTSTQS